MSKECVVRILKNRWRVLGKRFDSSTDFAVKTAVACTVLHNVCIMNSDEWNDRGEDDGDDGRDDDLDDIRVILTEYISCLSNQACFNV